MQEREIEFPLEIRVFDVISHRWAGGRFRDDIFVQRTARGLGMGETVKRAYLSSYKQQRAEISYLRV